MVQKLLKVVYVLRFAESLYDLELASAALFFSRVSVFYDFKSRYPHVFASSPRLPTEHIGNMFAGSPLNALALAARYFGLTWILYACAL